LGNFIFKISAALNGNCIFEHSLISYKQNFTIMKNQLITNYFLLLLLIGLLSGCTTDIDPNEEANNNLNGTWGVESFRVDGVEQMQFTLNSFEMEFRKEDEVSGETEWTIVDFLGQTTTTDGNYVIMDDGSRIELDGDELNLEINGDFLTIDGNVGGEFWEFDAERE